MVVTEIKERACEGNVRRDLRIEERNHRSINLPFVRSEYRS